MKYKHKMGHKMNKKGVLEKIGVALILFCGCLSSVSEAWAGSESASLMTFSTQGPDCYADGTPVLDGEYYALVWQTAAAGEVKFTMAGEPVDSANAVVLRALPLANDGCCPPTTFAVESDALPKLAKSGVLRLYLLDTRVYENATPTVGGLECVQAAASVTATCKVESGAKKGLLTGDFSATELAEDVPQPRITAISLAADVVTLTVADTVDGINYTAVDPMSGESLGEVVPVTGKTGSAVQIVVPRRASSSGFFRVERK